MRRVHSAEIIAVGSELLSPYRIDTNSLFITGRLNDVGIDVVGKSVVGDDRDALADRVREAMARVDLVVTTGGLGPTDDDVTREVVAGVAGRPLVEDPAALEAMRARFARRRMAMPDINRRQVQFPQGATALANPNGTAPGLLLETPECLLLLLPGPRRELEPMFESLVLPHLTAAAGGTPRRRRVVKLTGRPESRVEELVRPLDAAWLSGAVPVARTILATPGQIELHLSASRGTVAEMDAALDAAVGHVASALGSAVFSTDGRSLEVVVGDHLCGHGWRLAAAESCTGGLLLGRLTDVPGSSAWIAGGVVAYDNTVKTNQLGVPLELLEQQGAVSQPVAQAMARGVRERLSAEVGVGITGIAGPSGGSDAKPVGTVVIAVDGPRAVVRTFMFPGDRAMVRSFAVAAALDEIRRLEP